MSKVGATIVKLRKEKDVGQKELAAFLGMSIPTISNYEKNVHAPDLSTLCRLADYFQVTTDYLLGRTNYRCTPEVLVNYLTSDYTVNNIVNTIISLNPDARKEVIHFVDYMKNKSEEQPDAPTALP